MLLDIKIQDSLSFVKMEFQIFSHGKNRAALRHFGKSRCFLYVPSVDKGKHGFSGLKQTLAGVFSLVN